MGHVKHMGEKRCVYGIWEGKPEGKRPLGRHRHRCDDNIKIDLQEVGWGHRLDLSGSGLGQVAGICECGTEPSGSIK